MESAQVIEIKEKEPVAEAAPAIATSPERFINRELSWLAFNRRVLEEALDPSWPLFERVKFLAIFHSNLDEFFMIRVSGLQGQIDSEDDVLSPDGISPETKLRLITERLRPASNRSACRPAWARMQRTARPRAIQPKSWRSGCSGSSQAPFRLTEDKRVSRMDRKETLRQVSAAGNSSLACTVSASPMRRIDGGRAIASTSVSLPDLTKTHLGRAPAFSIAKQDLEQRNKAKYPVPAIGGLVEHARVARATSTARLLPANTGHSGTHADPPHADCSTASTEN